MIEREFSRAAAKARAGDALPLCELLWPGVRLDAHQLDMVNCIVSGRCAQVFAKGCTASGKTTGAAIAAVLWFLLNPACKIIFSSATFDHAKAVIYGEFCRWSKHAAIPMPAEPGREELFLNEQRYVKIGNPATGEGFSGQHSVATLFCLDECTAIPDEKFDLATTQAACIVALANPRTLSGWFRRGFPADRLNETCTIGCAFGLRRCITIDGADCLNVKEGREIIPGQLTRADYEGLCAHHSPRWVEIFAHGRFPDEDPELQIVAGSWLPAHQAAWRHDMEILCFGLDCADSVDGDATVLAAGGYGGCHALHIRRMAGTMETVGWVLSTARSVYGIDLTAGLHPMCIDADGLGKGIADRLIEQGVPVRCFRGSETPIDGKAYFNARVEAWARLGDHLNPEGPHGKSLWALPHDPLLFAELCAPERVYTSDGVKFKITPKNRTAGTVGETLKEKLGRSPDRADAVVYLHEALRLIPELAQERPECLQLQRQYREQLRSIPPYDRSQPQYWRFGPAPPGYVHVEDRGGRGFSIERASA